MNKSDLKTGMMVEMRDGEVFVVIMDDHYNGGDIIVSRQHWTSLNNFYYDDLTHKDGMKNLDIVKVYKRDQTVLDFQTGDLIWERQEFGKKDLKSGMVVVNEGDRAAVVVLGVENKGDIIVGKDWWNLLDNYDEDLKTNRGGSSIKEVYEYGKIHFGLDVKGSYNAKLVWKRGE